MSSNKISRPFLKGPIIKFINFSILGVFDSALIQGYSKTPKKIFLNTQNWQKVCVKHSYLKFLKNGYQMIWNFFDSSDSLMEIYFWKYLKLHRWKIKKISKGWKHESVEPAF